MAELLKDRYNDIFFDKLIIALKDIYPDLQGASFKQKIFSDDWASMELKHRMHHISVTLNDVLPGNYPEQIGLLCLLPKSLMKVGFQKDGFEFMFLPDFIESFGMDSYKVSVKAIEKMTQFVSCEFAVRPFILKFTKPMIKQMAVWSKHKHPSVRRLSTEGIRPRLPWAMGLPFLKVDPAPIIPILERLKNDTSEYVRRSVANNLNDISKDHPDLVVKLAKEWKGTSPETDWVIKHACRTLLKQGDLRAMKLFGFGAVSKIEIADFEIINPRVKIGESMIFTFTLKNLAKSKIKIRLEYGLYYQKANGTLSRKVFTISEKEYPKLSITRVERKQSFKVISTRRFYLGKHQVSIIINGVELETMDFELIK